MGSSIKRFAFSATSILLLANSAFAWYGPICYSDKTTQLTLTIPSISGETPGDLKVDFDDNDGKVKLGGVRASPTVKNAHEVLLVRDADSENGVFAVVVTSPRSTTGYKFELEFRKDASECAGAIIKATDHAGGGLLAHAPSSAVTLASAHVKHAARKPKASPSPAPAEESDSALAQAATDPAQPLPTPSAGSEAPVVSEKQETAEAPKAEAPQSEAPKSEAPAQPTATPQEAGSDAPAVSEKQQAGEAPKSEAPRNETIQPATTPAEAGSAAPAEGATGIQAQ